MKRSVHSSGPGAQAVAVDGGGVGENLPQGEHLGVIVGVAENGLAVLLKLPGGDRENRSAYGISGEGVAKGIRLIESVKTLCLSLVYLSLDVRIFLNMKGKETRR